MSGADASRPRVILTQDSAGAADWIAWLGQAGIPSCHWPAFVVESIRDEQIVDALHQGQEGVILPSPTAVRAVSKALLRTGRHWPRTLWVALPGSGSARAFVQHIGADVPMIVPPPPAQDGLHMASQILHVFPRCRHILVLNRPGGRRDWAVPLEAAGIVVQWQAVYNTCAQQSPPSGFARAWERWMTTGRGRQGISMTAPDWIMGSAGVMSTVRSWLGTLDPALATRAADRPVWVPHPRLLAQAFVDGFNTPRVYHDRQQLIERLQSGEA